MRALRHERFADFATTPPLKGLGSSVELVRRIVGNDAKTLDLLDRAVQRKAGQPPHQSIGVNHPNDRSVELEGRDRSSKQLRRLRKDFPELHAAVLAEEMTIHAAALEAGIYPKRASVNLADAASAARTLREQASPEFLAELRRHLEV